MPDTKQTLTPLGQFTLTAIPGSYINARTRPTTGAPDVGDLRKGDVVTLYSPQALGWQFVASPTVEGWVSLQNGAVVFTPLAAPDETWKVTLDVDYVPQASGTANHYRNDCGCASALMCLRWRYRAARLLDPVLMTVDELATKTTLPLHDDGLTSEQLVALMRGYGVACQKVVLLTARMVRAMLDNSDPLICLLNYGHFNPASSFKGGHFAVAVGYSNNRIYFNDPFEGGARFAVADAALDLALTNVGAFSATTNQGVILTK